MPPDLGPELPDEDWFAELQRVARPRDPERIGPYELVDEASRGGQGVVYHARQVGTGREVALKRVLAGGFATEEASLRFRREVEAAAGLRHPGVVTVYGVDEVEGHWLLVMEWIDGVPVTDWARGTDGAAPDLPEVLGVFAAVCDAVQHAHQNGVLHRDLKPSNVLVDATDQPRVVDFGLAKRLEDEDSDATRTGDFLGTPAYASPEQFDVRARPDARSDVYALGVLLYEMLTGRRPHGDPGDLRSHLDALEREDVRPPSSLRRDVHAEIDAIVGKCLAFRPEDRYQTVDGLASDLRRHLRGEAVLAHPPSTWYQLKKLARRHRAAAALIVVVAALVAISGAVFAWQSAVLASQRDAALVARDAEALARGQLADAQVELEAERDRVQSEADRSQAVVDYFLQDVIPATNEWLVEPLNPLHDAIDASLPRIADRFVGQPLLEAAVRTRIAEVYTAMAQRPKALVQCDLVLALLEGNVPERSLEHAAVHTVRARSIRSIPESAEAAEFAWDMASEHDPPPGRLLLESATEASISHLALGDFDAARVWSVRAIDAGRAHGLELHRDFTVALGLLAQTHTMRYEFDVAEELLREAHALRKEVNGGKPDAEILHSLAFVAAARGNFEGAIEYALQEEVLMLDLLGPDQAMHAQPILTIAHSLERLGRLDDAEHEALRALELIERVGGIAASRARACNYLGEIKRSQGEHEAAIYYLRETLGVCEDLRIMESGLAANAAFFLAQSLVALGRFDEAREPAELALRAFEAIYPPDGTQVTQAHGVLFEVFAGIGCDGEAEDHGQLWAELLSACPWPDPTRCIEGLRRCADWWEERDPATAARWREAADELAEDV